MNSSRIRITPLISAAALALAVLVPAPAATASAVADGPAVAQAAKKKHKKKRKKRKKRPAAPAAPVDANRCAGEDAFDPDDSLSTAGALAYPPPDAPIPHYLCPNDTDFFKLVLPGPHSYIAEVHPAAGVDLGLRVYNQDGEVAMTLDDRGAGGVEGTGFVNGGSNPATFRFEVFATQPGQEGAYSLIPAWNRRAAAARAAGGDGPTSAEAAKKGKKKKKKRKRRRPSAPAAPTAPTGPAVPPPECVDDAAEQDDSMQTASTLLFPTAGPWARHRCPGDPDFFKVTVPERLDYRVTVDAAAGFDHALTVFNSYGDMLFTIDAAGAGEVESVRVFGEQDAADTWYVEVTGHTADAQGAYAVTGSEE